MRKCDSMNRRRWNGEKTRPKRQARDTILILCGGHTEKVYFDNFKSRIGKIVVEPMLDADSPKNMVLAAIEKAKSSNYLQVWCVFDKDNFKCFDKAIQLADENKIGVAFSNQAFELWFILHFKKYEGALHRDKYKKEINSLLKRKDRNILDKPYNEIFALLKSRIDTAILHAKLGHQKHIRDNAGRCSNWESCTTVYKLVENLLKFE
ncbi:MAG: RloB family protein [Clostridia bacterium]|nr:RloB family protein [Clostridia bacterium]